MPNNKNILNAEIVVPLKYLSIFWRSLDFLLINCETEFGFPGQKSVQYLSYQKHLEQFQMLIQLCMKW